MIKLRIFLKFLLICFFAFELPLWAVEDKFISGTVEDVDGEHIYVVFEKTDEIKNGLVFGVYDFNKQPIGICEITRLRYEKSFLAFVLVQIEEIKTGYTVFSNLSKEYELRGKIKKQKDSGIFFDFYKNFSVSSSYKESNFAPKLAEDFLLYKVFSDTLSFIGIDIYRFSQQIQDNTKQFQLSKVEKGFLKIYRDILAQNSIFKIDKTDKVVLLDTKVNLGKLKRRLRENGFSLKPKIIRLVFSHNPSSEIIKNVREKIFNNSMYVSREQENTEDITNPISCVIYTTPKIFAQEIGKFDMEDMSITPKAVYGDTIELAVKGGGEMRDDDKGREELEEEEEEEEEEKDRYYYIEREREREKERKKEINFENIESTQLLGR